jgi:hypothetical protein
LHRALSLEHLACRLGQLQRTVFGHVDMHQPPVGGKRSSRRGRRDRCRPEGGQLVVVPLLDLVGCLATQDVGQVRDAEAHAGAENGRQRFLRRLRAIPQFRRLVQTSQLPQGRRFAAKN